ncbi:hypothetical protein KP509_34G041700 [Ceratopteris richardii]|uniref:Uncharacterized protein n=1 Tax=Ceratopteris richardii TaxID=49495 RepID=A0A8T2QL67_CERRI|nr:hypothetical protein KP509_34G041700 [Ceratopteris richardii]
MSETKKFAFKWVNDAYEDDLFTWLQYPTGDSFDRSYCDEILDGGWPLPLTSPAEAVTAKLPDEINHSDGANATRCRADRLANRSSDRSTNTSEYGGVKSILEPRHYFNSTIDRALAEGAARAAGQTLIATEDPCGKVRTLMQPSQTDPHSRSGSGDLESWKHAIQQNTGPYVSTSSVPVSAAVDQGRTDPFSATGTLPSHPRQRKHGASDTAEAKAAKDIRDYEVHSRNYLADSSRVTENGFGRQGKMVNHADQEHTATSSSWLGTSQGTSSSMSFRGASASGKRKQADLETLNLSMKRSIKNLKGTELPKSIISPKGIGEIESIRRLRLCRNSYQTLRRRSVGRQGFCFGRGDRIHEDTANAAADGILEKQFHCSNSCYGANGSSSSSPTPDDAASIYWFRVANRSHAWNGSRNRSAGDRNSIWEDGGGMSNSHKSSYHASRCRNYSSRFSSNGFSSQ